MYAQLYFLVFLISIHRYCESSIQCLDENGIAVDWLVLYKLPKIHDHPKTNIQKGIGYLHLTSNSLSSGWILSDLPITSEKSIPGRIIFSIFQFQYLAQNEINNEIIWLLYNDQPPNKNFSEVFGHTKGTIIGDKNGGLWLVHSVPNFPSLDEGKYLYPQTAYRYGQSFLCISMGRTNLNEIGTQLMMNYAWIYNSSIEGEMRNLYPKLFSATKEPQIKSLTHKQIFYSNEKQKFTSFAKSSKFGKDLYSQWVSAALQSELFVETWTHGTQLPTVCNETYPVYNVNNISLMQDTITFESSADHSKWAVSNSIQKPWVCVGDINRIDSQVIRGGGTVCINNADLWVSYFKSAVTVDPCPK